MKPSEKIEQLEKELATAQETNAALAKEIEMLKSQRHKRRPGLASLANKQWLLWKC